MSILTKLGLQYSRLSILIIVILIVTGLFKYSSFPKREDPSITIRTAIVIAQNNGLTQLQQEELIALPLEKKIRAIEAVSEVRTLINSKQVLIQVDINDETKEKDLKKVFDTISDDVALVAPSLPKNTLGPIVLTDFGDVSIATIAVTAPGFSYTELEDISESLQDELYTLKEVTAVTLYGTQNEVITLEVDQHSLSANGITLDLLNKEINDQNVYLSAGEIEVGTQRIQLRATGAFNSLEDISSLLINLPDGTKIKLGDLVKVRREYQEPITSAVFRNGQPAITLAVEMGKEVDITSLGPKLKLLISNFEANQPLGVHINFSTFQSDVVSDSVNNALSNMLQTFLVVFAVMFIFIGWREALIIASIVPLTISFAFILMEPFGVELQQVSIAAIIISLGLLVDNGLVIIEDMQRRVSQSTPPLEAALEAGKQYATPLLIASTTTVSAFLPLFLLDGTEGQYGYSLGMVVMLMLIGSFLSALFLLPRIAVWLLPNKNLTSNQTKKTYIIELYKKTVLWSINSPRKVIIFTVLIIVVGALSMKFVSSQMFPLSQRAQFLVYLDMPKGTKIEETEKVSLAFSEWMKSSYPNIVDITSYVGTGGPRFVLSLDPADAEPSSAFMIVNTTSFKASEDILESARTKVRELFPEAQLRLKRLAMGGKEPGIDIEISGPNKQVLLDSAKQIQESYLNAANIIQNHNDWGNRVFEGEIKLDQNALREYGLSSASISKTLKGMYEGHSVSVFNEDDKQIPIVLRVPEEQRVNYASLTNSLLRDKDQSYSLMQFATFEPKLIFSTIRRINQTPAITVSVISESMTAKELYEHSYEILNKIQNEIGDEYEITIGGEIEDSQEVREKLGGGFPIALIVMAVALMIQFNSFKKVAIVFLSIPLVIVGVPIFLTIFNQPLSFFGTLGLIALAGIIVNNAIVLIDQIDLEILNKTINPVYEASIKRFKPIVLTSLTTLVGLTPMAINGGALWEPMATLMIGGLGFASILTLYFVPALYSIFFKVELEH